jgi:hypothetical protein
VGSRDINASVACANIGAFVAAAFITFEPKAAVALVTNLTSFRIRRRLRRRMSRHIADFGGMQDVEGFEHSKHCYAASWGIACSTNRKNRVLRVRDLNLMADSSNVR